MEWRKPAEMTARRPMTSDGDPALRIGPERIAHRPVVVVH
jgi:hypothetical protein